MSDNGNEDNDAGNITKNYVEEPKRHDIDSDSDDKDLPGTPVSIGDINEGEPQNQTEGEQEAAVQDLQDSMDYQLTKAGPDLTSVPETLQTMNYKLDEILSLFKSKKGKEKSKSKT